MGGLRPDFAFPQPYLYAWFAYRFYPVAEYQGIACLELALRERLKEEIRTGKIKGKRPTLRPLLKYAVDHGLVKNEGFSAWQNRGEIRSRSRLSLSPFTKTLLPVELSGKLCIVRLHIFDQTSVVPSGVR